MAGNAAKKIMKWQADNAANTRPQTITGAMIAWGKIDDEKGRGVFALRDVKKGEVVELAPVIPVSKESINQNGEAPDGYLLDWDGNYENEEFCMPLGYIMMYNHSSEPNIGLEQDFDEYTMTVSALRDIKKGEELCWNYNCKIWWEDDEEEGE